MLRSFIFRSFVIITLALPSLAIAENNAPSRKTDTQSYKETLARASSLPSVADITKAVRTLGSSKTKPERPGLRAVTVNSESVEAAELDRHDETIFFDTHEVGQGAPSDRTVRQLEK